MHLSVVHAFECGGGWGCFGDFILLRRCTGFCWESIYMFLALLTRFRTLLMEFRILEMKSRILLMKFRIFLMKSRILLMKF